MVKKREADIPVTPSSGNVFVDLGFTDSDEELTKAQLVSHIRQIIERRRLTQVAAASLMGLSKIGGVSKRSVRLDSRIPHDLAVRLEQIANICALVAGYFEGDIDKTALWFQTPNPMLGDISPRDMIRFGRYKRLLKFVTEARETNWPTAEG